ncbi:OB-fold nucleic acid binding domain-containing protein [Actinospica durhamensis]|uniref:OB-fold nucleic acid binding domain-containing protein n=1 Tax=Actinospica durhamensis TaxID=1508375 RepID=A0A941EYG2_9ACTN|nr:OB-fold nucleic acid binding domain-containing protein [Actinospica durhamensis]MBR7838687.1 OB-fold nucleic acid binding domain-containing protein [Actinospica durhamensis]
MRESDTTTATSEARRAGLLKRVFSRLTADTEELDAADLKAAIPAQGATPIARCRDREPVCILGTLRTVTFRPRAGVPALQAELWDGTGTVSVVWLGRRSIPGISPGRVVKVRGRITTLRGQRVIYNPIYELRPGGSD